MRGGGEALKISYQLCACKYGTPTGNHGSGTGENTKTYVKVPTTNIKRALSAARGWRERRRSHGRTITIIRVIKYRASQVRSYAGARIAPTCRCDSAERRARDSCPSARRTEGISARDPSHTVALMSSICFHMVAVRPSFILILRARARAHPFPGHPHAGHRHPVRYVKKTKKKPKARKYDLTARVYVHVPTVTITRIRFREHSVFITHLVSPVHKACNFRSPERILCVCVCE